MKNSGKIEFTRKDCIKELKRIGFVLKYNLDSEKPISFSVSGQIPRWSGRIAFLLDIFSITKQEWDDANQN